MGPGESEENASGGERDGGSVSAETGDKTVVRSGEARGEQAEPPGSTEECGKRGGTGEGAVNDRENVEASAMDTGVAGEGGGPQGGCQIRERDGRRMGKPWHQCRWSER